MSRFESAEGLQCPVEATLERSALTAQSTMPVAGLDRWWPPPPRRATAEPRRWARTLRRRGAVWRRIGGRGGMRGEALSHRRPCQPPRGLVPHRVRPLARPRRRRSRCAGHRSLLTPPSRGSIRVGPPAGRVAHRPAESARAGRPGGVPGHIPLRERRERGDCRGCCCAGGGWRGSACGERAAAARAADGRSAGALDCGWPGCRRATRRAGPLRASSGPDGRVAAGRRPARMRTPAGRPPPTGPRRSPPGACDGSLPRTGQN